ncbi:MAG: repeat protein [Segetibacter sp.]|nr:repeat protein [Segetibacter sp.]
MFLLNTSVTDTFATFVKPGYLYAAALFFFILTVIVVIATYYTLHLKKKKYRFKTNIRQNLEEWITEVILNDSSAEVTVPDNFLIIFKEPEARQMLIDELVRNKSSFLGSVSDNIIKLYYQLGLNVDSIIKLNDPRPHIQCQGIHELCVMEQKDLLSRVYRYTNSKDKDVRMEAQTAIIQWYGFKGLRFLDVVSYPVTEFQQLRLLELLRVVPFAGLPKLNKWLILKNDTVVVFALKLAQHYKQAQVQNEAAQCLHRKNDAIRLQAVKTLAVIGDSSTANLLTLAYPNEKFTNRLNILRELPKIATDEQRDFLIVQLHEGHEYLKLASAKVLAKCTTEGMEILEAKSYDEPIPYRDIYLHVKSEAVR